MASKDSKPRIVLSQMLMKGLDCPLDVFPSLLIFFLLFHPFCGGRGQGLWFEYSFLCLLPFVCIPEVFLNKITRGRGRKTFGPVTLVQQWLISNMKQSKIELTGLFLTFNSGTAAAAQALFVDYILHTFCIRQVTFFFSLHSSTIQHTMPH